MLNSHLGKIKRQTFQRIAIRFAGRTLVSEPGVCFCNHVELLRCRHRTGGIMSLIWIWLDWADKSGNERWKR